MTVPYGGDTEACKLISREDLEATFWYPGPPSSRTQPAPSAQKAWDEAKETCLGCPFYLRCRDTSLGEPYGVWGGRDQRERHVERVALKRRLKEMAPEARRAEAGRVYAVWAGHRGGSFDGVAIRTGYPRATVKTLVTEHEETRPGRTSKRPPELTPVEMQQLISMASKGVALSAMQTALGRGRALLETALIKADIPPPASPVKWPPMRPKVGDGWIWHHHMVRSAHYVGETADGAYIFVKFRVKSSPTRQWLPRALVHLTGAVDRTVMRYSGREGNARDPRGETVSAVS